MNERLLDAALRLHRYLLRAHWRNGALIGPTPGIRLNLWAWRFVKSYLPYLRWGDECVSFQGLAYWIFANWDLHRLTREDEYGGLALEASHSLLSAQREDGAWPNPIPQRRSLITTIEGLWAGAALLSTYERTGEPSALEGALKWSHCMDSKIGYHSDAPDGLAINYFDRPRGKVPNNSTAALWFLGELDAATEADRTRRTRAGLLAFLRRAQTSAGEMPYELPAPNYKRFIPHYQCYQYNAFELIDLHNYWTRSRCDDSRTIATGIARFVAGGVLMSGACSFSCKSKRPHVIYHAAAAAHALGCADRWGLGDYAAPSKRALAWVLDAQRPDGSFPFSVRDYGLLSDRRSYPANQAMILLHLIREASAEP